jgi:phage terminase large subunit-like protein
MTDTLIPTPAALQAEYEARKVCRWYKYYPDEGPYRRSLYPKHVAFFKAGATWRQRLFLAANRCLTAETLISTVDGPRTMGSLYEAGQPFHVWAWDVEEATRVNALASAPFKKPSIADCYRITMDDGRWIEGSSEHRILDDDANWVTIADLWLDPNIIQNVSSVGGCRIVSVEGIGARTVYDFTVPDYACYLAAGLVHHNSGKTDAAAYEMTCHLTGHYPHWWEGKKFDHPVECWASGDTSGTSRNIIQVALLGSLAGLDQRKWSGMLPPQMVYDFTRKQGLPSAVSSIWVRHKSGGLSTLDILSYDQKREAFQGTAKHVIWLDEEPPDEIYGECLIRTMTTGGLLVVTMTPLMGLTPFLSEWLSRSALEVLGPDGTSQLTHAHSAVFGERG